MNYEEALEYIHGTLKFGSKLGLENIRILLELMGNPQKKLKFIHIAGTNGKGSTTAMVTQILIEAGYKVGMYTSPYIEEFTERIQVSGRQIDKQHLADITEQVKAYIQIMVEQGHNHPTEFEIVTAIAFQYYYDLQCDYVVLEVGLGGRFDATNIIEEALVSVITSISMDHMEWLGDTLEKIAYEKGGIIKKNGLAVLYPEQESDVKAIIAGTCLEKNAELIQVDSSFKEIVSETLEGIKFHYKELRNLRLNLLGSHQVLNAITAITVVDILNRRYHLEIMEEHIRKGLEKVRWPGRLEVLSVKPLFIVDGAHNVSGITALAEALEKYGSQRNITLIIGMLRDKEYERCLDIIAPKANRIITTTPINPRAVSAEELGRIANRYCNEVFEENDIREAIKRGICNRDSNDLICCCGSLYLIAHIRKIFKKIYK
ncbi:MAG: folylpolyglutamate synthase/dihydrofolate synthase family protein [Clostridia bacterium]